MEAGQLVPDDLTIRVVQERTARDDCRGGYILDGFPRTLPQAEGFEHMSQGDVNAQVIVFNVDVPRAELLRRLSGRRWCPTCQATYHVDNNPPKNDCRCDREGTKLIQREDDKETAVARRLTEYDAATAPLIDYYRGRSRFHDIDGYRPVDSVFGQLKQILDSES